MEWAISILISIVILWCGISFFCGLLFTCEDEYELSELWKPFRITFVIEISVLLLIIFWVVVCKIREIIFVGGNNE